MMRVVGVAVVLGGWLVSSSVALGADRTADKVLKDIDAVKMPTLDPNKKDDKSYVKDNQIRRREAAQKRARLIGELYKIAPDHKRVPALLEERWKTIGTNPEKGKYDELIRELDKVIAQTKDKKLKIEAAFTKAQLKLNPISSKHAPDPSGVDEFVKLAPKDPRAASLLGTAVSVTDDEKKKAALIERLRTEFPDSDLLGMLEETHNQRESLGKPFHLEFTNAIDGSTVSMKNLRGKVVVIDFWATWCGPCVAEMPKMKKLYAEYHDRGVEFIGVSLDQPKEKGGLDSLKKFVKEKGIEWPQYYQGNFWKSKFSSSWGINSIPCVFVVDTEGKLDSVEARGKLEKMIPELLEKKTKVAQIEKLRKESPDSELVAMLESHSQSESLGKPFHLEFTNAIDGSTVSMKSLRGKVVIIDFWATWCGPCVAEMPKMKKLYAEYHDRGVEFIGVSLDQPKEQGGLDRLKKFVKEHGIAWPQYYQGNFWKSEFSSSWGINSIPCVFVVDTEGNLHSVKARGKLEKMIPELLEKKTKVATGGGA